MKLTKTFILAASALALAPEGTALFSADVVRHDGDQTVVGYLGVDDSVIADGATWNIWVNTGHTTSGRWLDYYLRQNPESTSSYDYYIKAEPGEIVLTGLGTLEYTGWQHDLCSTEYANENKGGFYSGKPFTVAKHPTFIHKPLIVWEDFNLATSGATHNAPAFSGTLRIQDSVNFVLSGYLNQFYGGMGEAFDPIPSVLSVTVTLDPETGLLEEDELNEIVGVEQVILADSATLSFNNSPANIVSRVPSSIHAPPPPMIRRYNLVQNLQSEGSQTTLYTGVDSGAYPYHVGVHVHRGLNAEFDSGRESYYGAGFVRGEGELIKTGIGDFEITNDPGRGAGLTGSIKIAGGTFILSSPGGEAIADADSVTFGRAEANSSLSINLSLIFDSQYAGPGHILAGWPRPSVNISNGVFRPLPQIVPDRTNGSIREEYLGRTFLIVTDQRIRNFQAMCMQNDITQPMNGGLGVGAVLDLRGNRLTIIQDMGSDGLFLGALWATDSAVLEKRGPGTIGFFGRGGDNEELFGKFDGLIDIEEGGVVANVQSLGFGRVHIAKDGLLKIVQTDAGSLGAELSGNIGGELRIGVTHSFSTRDGTAVWHDLRLDGAGTGDVGFVQINRSQPKFAANLVIEDGVRVGLVSSRMVNGQERYTLDVAESVQLVPSVNVSVPRESTLAFGNTSQKFNNLSGIAPSRLELGRGNVTIHQSVATAFDGRITGTGNVVALVDTEFSLGGNNSHFGATVIKPYYTNSAVTVTLGLEGGNAIHNSSGLVLYAGATVVSATLDEQQNKIYQSQHVGMLFGETGSRIDMGDATLTVGVDAEYRRALEHELATMAHLDLNVKTYAAYYFNTTDEGGKLPLSANPMLPEFNMGSARYYLDEGLKVATDFLEVVRDENGSAIWDDNGNVVVQEIAGRGLNNADELAYAGSITGSGEISKVGDQRLSFSGTSPEFTGLIKIREGIMRMNPDSFPAVPRITVFKNAEAEFLVKDSSLTLTMNAILDGEGDLSKVGPGKMVVLSYEYTGQTLVKDGILQIPVKPILHEIYLGNVLRDVMTQGVISATPGTIDMLVPEGQTVTHAHSIYEAVEAGDPATVPAFGSLIKSGLGVLILQGNGQTHLGYTGKTQVLEGELIFAGKTTGSLSNIPETQGGYEVSSGATLSFDVDATVAQAPRINDELAGAGTLRKLGAGQLEIYRQQNNFTGDILVSAGDLSLFAVEAFINGNTLKIEDGARVWLNGNDQSFKNLSGGRGSELVLGAANVTFNTTLEQAQSFDGVISGHGDIVKSGPGVLTLRGSNTGVYTGTFVLNNGTLDVTTDALGGGSVSTSPRGVLNLYSANTLSVDRFSGLIAGPGALSKTGVGSVHLAWDGSAPADALGTSVTIKEGLLIVDSARNNNSLPKTDVASGAAFQINLQTDGIYYNGNISSSDPAGNVGYGLGSFIIDGLWEEEKNTGRNKYSLIMASRQLYGGVTRVQNGAILNVSLLSELTGSISADKTSILDFGNVATAPDERFLIRLNDDAEFWGTFTGSASLEIGIAPIVEEGKFPVLRYYGPDGTGNLGSYNGSIAVAGGNLQVGIANQKDVLLASEGTRDGTLYINVRGDDETPGPIKDGDLAYTARVTGNGNIIKTGKGHLNASNLWFLSRDLDSFRLARLIVEEGSLTVNPASIGTWLVQQYDIATVGEGLFYWETTGTDPQSINAGKLSGNGTFIKIGTASLTLGNQPEFTGNLINREGRITGEFLIGGSFVNESILAPGITTGTVTINGDFSQGEDAVLEIEISGKDYDKVIYTKNAYLDGQIKVTNIGSGAKRGEKYTFIEKRGADAQTAVLGRYARIVDGNNSSSGTNEYFMLVGPGLGEGTAYEKLTDGDGNPLTGPTILVAQKKLANVSGYTPHKALKETFLPVLDTFATLRVTRAALEEPLLASNSKPDREQYEREMVVYRATKATYEIGSYLNTATERELSSIVNSLSPLGYSSFIAMAAAGVNASTHQLTARADQRRYDRGSLFLDKQWQAYLLGSSSFGDLGGSAKDVSFRLNTNGGLVGVDRSFADNTILGAAVAYNNGSSTLDSGGGRTKLNAVNATGYLSHVLGHWFGVDVGAGGGYLDFDSTRNTVTGKNTANAEGLTFGAYATLSSVLAVAKGVSFSPYVGTEYNHYEVYGFTERGSSSALKVSAFDLDSWRVKFGTRFSIAYDLNYDQEIRFNLDVSYVHELMDTDNKLTSHFVQIGEESTSRVTSKTLAKQLVRIGPSVSMHLSESLSVFTSYQAELGFDGELYHNVNAGVRLRF
ncbi:MAG: autotransporter domain-containing protein [Puniceicoccales bacterium]|jgi:autotransporter-associated beta strand protein|nr:autotransporter domain-containing protein [Puniceicoccales bacterium]